MRGDIYTSREVMDNLEVLCDEFGSRWAGTEGERRAAEFLLQRLQAYGLSLKSIEEAVRGGNAEIGARIIEMAGTEYVIRGRG